MYGYNYFLYVGRLGAVYLLIVSSIRIISLVVFFHCLIITSIKELSLYKRFKFMRLCLVISLSKPFTFVEEDDWQSQQSIDPPLF
jgi:hypothetical protein